MSEEYSHVGTVRRRPRADYQRSKTSKTNGRSNGAHKVNGDFRHEFEADPLDEGAAEEEARPRFRRSAKKERPRKALPYYGPELDEEPLFRFPFDPWRLFGAAKRNFGWIIAGALLLTLAGFFLAAYAVNYKVNLQLIRITPNAVRTEGMAVSEFVPREYSEQTLFAFMKSGEVVQRVVQKAATNDLLAPLKIQPAQVAAAVAVKPTPNPDIVFLSVEAFGGLRAMVELANLYAHEVISFTREIQQREARSVNDYLKEQIGRTDTIISNLTAELNKYSGSGFISYDKETQQDIELLRNLQLQLRTQRTEKEALDAKIQGVGGLAVAPKTKLEQARADLEELKLKFTSIHPSVQQKMAEIAQLEKQPDGGGPASSSSGGLGSNPLALRAYEFQFDRDALERRITATSNQIEQVTQKLRSRGSTGIEFDIKKAELDSHRNSRNRLQEREQQSRDYMNASLGYFDIHAPASLDSIDYTKRWIKVSILAIFAGAAGFLGALGIVMLTEIMDTTLRTPEDIVRVTGLPVLATLGDLRKMSAAAQVQWAFRTLTLLRGKLSRDADQALVCGIISANHGEGRSTWVNLLVSAASQRGLRVLTVDTRPTAAAPESAEPAPQPVAEEKVEAQQPAPGQPINLPDSPSTLNGSVLSAPAKVAEQLEDPNAQPLVHIPLPGWVWNLERRKQWQKALEYWKDIDNLVIFVELPPASEQESLLLAEHLPQVIWLTGSGMADASETATHIETLRHARCNLVGAVLNYAPPPFLNNRITRWFNRITTVVALCGTLLTAQAADDAAPEAEPRAAAEQQENLGFSASPRHKRAKWQQRLTFGPGDTVDIHFYGNPALSRTNVYIGPDGRINYLYASGLQAAGLTVEELRRELDEALAPYYTIPVRTIVLPTAFTSKKYFMLGKVNAKGAYPLDRPLTLIEAVARAKGLETGLYQRTSVELADLGRSFIVRDNEKLDVDFEKLFLEGDLSQNIAIEPNDYIFFASTGANDIYVLGEVMNPGPIGFVPNATVLSAIADRGGYSEKAFKRRVLVIRGSLNEPETFVVNSGGMLEAVRRDFRLQPRDIVYVSRRPWVKVEELLDEAASSFIQGAVTTWAGVNVGPIITKRLLPRARSTPND